MKTDLEVIPILPKRIPPEKRIIGRWLFDRHRADWSGAMLLSSNLRIDNGVDDEARTAAWRAHELREFVWTTSARSIARKVRHCNEALETGH